MHHSLLLFVCFFSFVLFFVLFFLCLMLDYFSSLLNSKLCLKWNTLTKALTDSKWFESIADSKWRERWTSNEECRVKSLISWRKTAILIFFQKKQEKYYTKRNVKALWLLAVSSCFHRLTFFPSACKDKDKRCKSWAWSGECKKNPKYMVINCPKSCTICPGMHYA